MPPISHWFVDSIGVVVGVDVGADGVEVGVGVGAGVVVGVDVGADGVVGVISLTTKEPDRSFTLTK